MSPELLRIAALLMIVGCTLGGTFPAIAHAVEGRPILVTAEDPELAASNWAPIQLISASSAASSSTMSPSWNPSLQTLEGLKEIGDYLPSTGGSSFPTAPTTDPNNANGQNASGSNIGGLPSFRGIKGIRNLPGGVGTLLMANPHVGSTFYPEQKTDQAGTSLSMQRSDFQGGVPIYSKGADTFVLTGDFEAVTVQTKAILPTTLQAFPSQLFNIAAGVNYFHQFEDGKIGGVVLEVGSASDKPFQSGREILASGTGFMLMPRDEESSWFVGVNASTNSQVLYGIPIPGGGYFYHPNDNLQAIVGFPFCVLSYKPAADWQLQYVYAFLTTMHARAIYQPTQQWQLYAGFDWTNENWRRADRPKDDEHFFYYEKKLTTGFLWWFKPHVGLELSGGYAFDRYFSEIDGFKLVGDNTVHIGAGPYVSAQIDLRF